MTALTFPAVVAGAPTTADEYPGFCEGLRELTGIDLGLYRRPQMERRLRSFLERRGIDRLGDALPVLRSDPSALAALVDRITINVSQLWRHPDQWRRLAGTVLPELAVAGRVRAWSAGCSYGAEAYTLAAVCREVLPGCGPESSGDRRAGVEVAILGTDIDRKMIARARAATFSTEDARDAEERSLDRGFTRVPGGWRPRAELRALTRFAVGDLLHTRQPAAAFDLVICRNTAIYFAEPVRDELHRRLAASLRPGGYLLVGATERIADPRAIGLEPLVPFFYRRA